jgi:hypothetical protein
MNITAQQILSIFDSKRIIIDEDIYNQFGLDGIKLADKLVAGGVLESSRQDAIDTMNRLGGMIAYHVHYWKRDYNNER